jgi:hypothetical protein
MPTADSAYSNEPALPYSLDYPPPDFIDPVIEAYKKDIDRTILRENLQLTVEERLRKHQNAQAFFEELRRAGKRARKSPAVQE